MDLAFQGMGTYREVSIVVGVLYLLGFVAGIFSIAHAVDDSDYLTKAALKSKQTNRAACFQFLMAICYAGIAVALYPILKIYNERVALGFFSFRILAVQFVLIGTVILLLLLKLSREFIKAGSSNSIWFQLTGDLLKTARDFVNHGAMIILLCISGIMLYVIMIQSRLIPMWLSVWGLVGSIIAILASILVMLKYLEVVNKTYIILNIPIALQEIVFAVWLIVKGFKQF